MQTLQTGATLATLEYAGEYTVELIASDATGSQVQVLTWSFRSVALHLFATPRARTPGLCLILQHQPPLSPCRLAANFEFNETKNKPMEAPFTPPTFYLPFPIRCLY